MELALNYDLGLNLGTGNELWDLDRIIVLRLNYATESEFWNWR